MKQLSFSYKYFNQCDFQGQIKVLVWFSEIQKSKTNIQHKTPQKDPLHLFSCHLKRLSNVVQKVLNHDAAWEKSLIACFLRCWGFSLRENERVCPVHSSSCLTSSLSLSSSTFSLSSSAVITPSLFRSWLLNMSAITCSMTSPGFIRPLPSATCSLMNSPN